MSTSSIFHQQAMRRRNRTRVRLAVNQELPRLSVHRSLRHISAQVIDDKTGRTLAAASDHAVETGAKTDLAAKVGALIAEKAKAAGVTAVRFDRGSYRYHGRVAALAEAARNAGLTF